MHVPVLLRETVEALGVRPGGVYLDGTLGGAGHAEAVMKLAGPEGAMLGIDRDPEALVRAAKRLESAPGRKVLVHGEHGRLAEIAAANGFALFDAILLDLGVSSDQLDTPERGFSFQAEGPLDMRMDPTAGESAADLVAAAEVGTLAEIFKRLGEEPQANRIARAIVKAREEAPIRTTRRLADVVCQALGRSGGPRHPATRVFQALRMAVNREMEDLQSALSEGLGLLRTGGRMAVITFESQTDRLVKHTFAAHAGRMESLQQGGERWVGEEPAVKLVTRHAVTAGAEELAENPRARSAKLRAVEKI